MAENFVLATGLSVEGIVADTAATEPLPLHVQVARALGCAVRKSDWRGAWDCGCEQRHVKDGPYYYPHAAHAVHGDCCHSGSGLYCDQRRLANYDTDWSAAGPLVEKYRIILHPPDTILPTWGARSVDPSIPLLEQAMMGAASQADTPLKSICHLILALAAAGKLEGK